MTMASPVLERLLQSGLEHAAARTSKKLDDWTDRLDEVASNAGAVEHGVAAGVGAALAGKNPVWGAVKGAWSGAGTKTRVLVVLTLVLMLVLAPVALVLLLLGLLVAGAIAGFRALSR